MQLQYTHRWMMDRRRSTLAHVASQGKCLKKHNPEPRFCIRGRLVSGVGRLDRGL